MTGEATQQQDLTVTVGDTYNHVFALFQDSRVKLWRGAWREYFTYEPGEAVELEPGEAFVCTARTMSAKPEIPGEYRSIYEPGVNYSPGESVQYEGAYYRCTKETAAVPTDTAHWEAVAVQSQEFWSPLTPMNLTGNTLTLNCEGSFTLKEGAGLTVAKLGGRVTVEVTPVQSEGAAAAVGTSTRYYVQRVNGEAKQFTAVKGTMIFAAR